MIESPGGKIGAAQRRFRSQKAARAASSIGDINAQLMSEILNISPPKSADKAVNALKRVDP